MHKRTVMLSDSHLVHVWSIVDEQKAVGFAEGDRPGKECLVSCTHAVNAFYLLALQNVIARANNSSQLHACSSTVGLDEGSCAGKTQLISCMHAAQLLGVRSVV